MNVEVMNSRSMLAASSLVAAARSSDRAGEESDSVIDR